MRHAWKIATVFLLSGLLLVVLRSQWLVTDAFAVPAVLACVIGFAAFVMVGSLRRGSR
jgi:hypothetical protein